MTKAQKKYVPWLNDQDQNGKTNNKAVLVKPEHVIVPFSRSQGITLQSAMDSTFMRAQQGKMYKLPNLRNRAFKTCQK